MLVAIQHAYQNCIGSDTDINFHTQFYSHDDIITYIDFRISLKMVKIIIIIFINRNWVITRWQWLLYMYTKHEIGY